MTAQGDGSDAARIEQIERRLQALEERQRDGENGFLFKMSLTIGEALDWISGYDTEGHVDWLRAHYAEKRYHVFVDEFYKLIGAHSPHDFIFFIEWLLKDADVNDRTDWRTSDANRLSIAIAVCLCKNLRILWRVVGGQSGNVAADEVCAFSSYVLPTFTGINAIAKLYREYGLEQANIYSKIMQFRPYVDFFLSFRDDIIDEFPDASGHWHWLEELRSYDTLDRLWESKNATQGFGDFDPRVTHNGG